MDEHQVPVATPIAPPPSPMPPAAGGRAVAALVLGILSLLCMGFLTGIPAIILGHMELAAIKAGKAAAAGESAAKVGYILGIIGTAFTCLTMLLFVILLALGISLGSVGEWQHALNSV
jgi:hypothetical protein